MTGFSLCVLTRLNKVIACDSMGMLHFVNIFIHDGHGHMDTAFCVHDDTVSLGVSNTYWNSLFRLFGVYIPTPEVEFQNPIVVVTLVNNSHTVFS